jgi:hypothetical protein
MIRLIDCPILYLYSTEALSLGRMYGAESTMDSVGLPSPIEPQLAALKASSTKVNVRQFGRRSQSLPSMGGDLKAGVE